MKDQQYSDTVLNTQRAGELQTFDRRLRLADISDKFYCLGEGERAEPFEEGQVLIENGGGGCYLRRGRRGEGARGEG